MRRDAGRWIWGSAARLQACLRQLVWGLLLYVVFADTLLLSLLGWAGDLGSKAAHTFLSVAFGNGTACAFSDLGLGFIGLSLLFHFILLFVL